MAFDFPSTPALNDEFVDTATGATYVWNGYAWTRRAAGKVIIVTEAWLRMFRP